MKKRKLQEDKPKGSGVDYSVVVDRQLGDSRFEREKTKSDSSSSNGLRSSTFDAFIRMSAGIEGKHSFYCLFALYIRPYICLKYLARTLQQKISDSNRPTW